jgi:hypothetical protein
MNSKDFDKVKKVAEILEWFLTVNGDELFFSLTSPAGQDFNVEISANSLEQLSKELRDYYVEFDVSHETYLWLDTDGHGMRGAPYDMKDAYEDMEWCAEKIEELGKEIAKLVD